MKKNSIVKDYTNIPVSGVYNMKEKANMMCSKMMDIEDLVRISYNFIPVKDTNNNIIGLDAPKLSLESDINKTKHLTSLLNISHSYAKENAIISLIVDKTQTKLDADNLTKWIFEFNSIQLLREYLYNEIYTLNPQSPFRQIPVADIPGNKISKLCYDYIDYNIISRYRLKEFILWTTYYELKNNTVPGSGTDAILNPKIDLLYKTPVFSFNAIPSNVTYVNQQMIDNKKETIAMKQYDNGIYDIAYKQTKSSQTYTFIYYYDAIFERI